MKKWIKLAISLTALTLVLGMQWAANGCPRFTAESAFRRVESRQLLPESRFLKADYYDTGLLIGKGRQELYTGVGVTDSHLRLVKLSKRGGLWHDENTLFTGGMLSLPLEGEITCGILPWRLASPAWHGIFVYTPLEAGAIRASVTIGDQVFAQEAAPQPGGYTQFFLEELLDHPLEDELTVRGYDLQGVGYDPARKNRNVTLEVVLFDENGQELARAVKHYPQN